MHHASSGIHVKTPPLPKRSLPKRPYFLPKRPRSFTKTPPLFFQNKNYFTKTPPPFYCQNGTFNIFFYSNKCGHRNVLSKRQVWMSIFHIINFKKKLILDYYFCLTSGPVFLFQIFIIAPLPLPRDIKLYH